MGMRVTAGNNLNSREFKSPQGNEIQGALQVRPGPTAFLAHTFPGDAHTLKTGLDSIHFSGKSISRGTKSSGELMQAYAQSISRLGLKADQPFPTGLHGTFPDTNISVIGAGSHIYAKACYRLLEKLNHIQGHEGDKTRTLFDPAFNTTAAGTAPLLHPELKGKRVASMDALPHDSIAYILSPTKFHADQLNTLLAKPYQGIYCEKPMVTTPEELAGLEKTLSKTTVPIVFTDHMYMAALGLIALMGKPAPYQEFLRIEQDTPGGELAKALKQSKPLLGKIVKVHGQLMESANPAADGRGWLNDRSKAGGVLFDAMIHLIDLTNYLDLKIKNINAVDLKAWRPDAGKTGPGKYIPLVEAGPDEAENYAHVQGQMQNGAQYVFSAAKNWPTQDCSLILEDEAGRKLKLLPYSPNSPVELLDRDNKVIGRIIRTADPDVLNQHLALTHLTSGETSPLFFQEQKDALNWLKTMQTAGQA